MLLLFAVVVGVVVGVVGIDVFLCLALLLFVVDVVVVFWC